MAQGAIIGQRPPEIDLTGLASEAYVQQYVQTYVQQYVKDNVNQPKYEVKTYEGTEVYDSGKDSRIIKIEFSFRPKFVIVYPLHGNTKYEIRGSGAFFDCAALTEKFTENAYTIIGETTSGRAYTGMMSFSNMKAKLQNNILSWYCESTGASDVFFYGLDNKIYYKVVAFG